MFGKIYKSIEELTRVPAILAFVPVDWISAWLGKQSLVTLFYVILIAIPLYTCSTPSIPVVQSLLLKGVSPGAAVAYLIAGPATNFGELAAIRSSMSKVPQRFLAAAC